VKPLGFVIALPDEARSIVKRKFQFDDVIELPGNRWIAISGTGPERAALAANKLITKGVESLVSWGCAAALQEGLDPGHLILPECVMDQNGMTFPIDANLRENVEKLLPPYLVRHSGPLVESRTIVESTAAKKSLNQRFGCVAVDMESVSVARVAFNSGLAFLCVRSIADHVKLNLPRSVSVSIKPRGDIQHKRLIIEILKDPRQIPELIALGWAFKSAMRSLKIVHESITIPVANRTE